MSKSPSPNFHRFHARFCYKILCQNSSKVNSIQSNHIRIPGCRNIFNHNPQVHYPPSPVCHINWYINDMFSSLPCNFLLRLDFLGCLLCALSRTIILAHLQGQMVILCQLHMIIAVTENFFFLNYFVGLKYIFGNLKYSGWILLSHENNSIRFTHLYIWKFKIF